MKFLLDENISYKTANFLNDLGYDAKSIFDFNLVGADDERIFAKAVSEKRALVTLDSDFGQIFYFSSKKSHPVIVLRVFDKTFLKTSQI